MILSVNIGLGDNKEILEEQLAKVLETVALPVGNPLGETLDDLLIVRSTMGFVDLGSDPLSSLGALAKLL